MADNTQVNSGSGGDLIVTREVSHGGDTAKLPGSFIVGISGTEGSYTYEVVNGSAANGLEVDVTRVTGTVTVDGSGVTQPVSGTVTANLSATDNAVLDSIDAAVNGTLTVDLGANNDVTLATLPDTAAGDLAAINTAVSGTLTVGTHAVTQSGTWTVDLGATDNAVLDAIAASVAGTLTVDASGTAVPVTDNGGSLTIDGTVAATQSGSWTVDLGATDNAVLDAIQAAVEGTLTVDLGANNDVIFNNAVDANNSSTSTLLSGATFTGTGTDVLGYRNVNVSVFADQASATDGLKIQFSSDNSNWDFEEDFTVSAGVGETHTVPVMAQYFRVVYVNGGTGQSAFRLQSILVTDDLTGTVANLDTTVDGTNQAVLTRSVLSAFNGTSYVNIQSTTAGNLKTALEEYDGVPVGGGVEAGSLRVTIANDSTGVLSVDDNGGSLTVDGTVTANLSATDNAVLDQIDSNTDYGAVTGGGTETGALRVTLANDSTGVVSVDDGGSSLTVDGTVTANAGTGTFTIQEASALDVSAATVTVDLGANNDVQGVVAHDSPVSGNPFLQGAEARSSEGTAVANGDAARVISDLVGKLVTSPYAPSDLLVDGTASATDANNTSVIAAQGAGVRTYITTVIIANTSSTATEVILKDGTTERARFPAPATTDSSGGCICNLPVPLRGTANTAWQFASADAVTTMHVSLVGYTGR